MMDFGFAAFLDKFEEHFGRAATKFLLMLLGLAAVSLCGSVIWNYLLKPLANAIVAVMPAPGSIASVNLAKVLVFVAFVMIGLNWGLQLINRFLETRVRARLRTKLQEARELSDEAKSLKRDCEAIQQIARDNCAAAELAFDHVVNIALERGLITPDQAAELQSLRDIEEETQP